MRPTIVFDLDGTLVDTAPDLAATMNALLAARGRPLLDLASVRHFVGHGARALMDAGMRRTGAPASEAELDEMLPAFIARYSANIAASSRPFPGAVEAVDRLRDQGCRLAVCTNKREDLARLLLDTLDLSGSFDAVLGGDSLPVKKPEAGHLTGTIQRAGGDIGCAVLVGDTETDVKAARAAGVPVVGVSFGYSPVPMAALAPDRLIDRFDQLHEALADLLPGFADSLGARRPEAPPAVTERG